MGRSCVDLTHGFRWYEERRRISESCLRFCKGGGERSDVIRFERVVVR